MPRFFFEIAFGVINLKVCFHTSTLNHSTLFTVFHSFQDPIIRSIYELISKYWTPKKSRGSKESLAEAQEPEGEEPEVPCLHDDYGESRLAEALGVPAVAQCQVVQPLPDSQILPDTFIGNDLGEHLPTPMEEEEIPASQPVPEHLSMELGDTYVDPITPASSEVAPTELEVTPQPSKVVEVHDSPAPLKITVTDPMPNADKYSPEDLAALQQKIAMIK